MTTALLERPERTTVPGATWISPALLKPGDVVVIEDQLPSSEGFVHVVTKAYRTAPHVRVFFDVWRDGERYRAVATPWRDYRWDRLYEMRQRRRVGHRRDCACPHCVELMLSGPMVEVMT